MNNKLIIFFLVILIIIVFFKIIKNNKNKEFFYETTPTPIKEIDLSRSTINFKNNVLYKIDKSEIDKFSIDDNKPHMFIGKGNGETDIKLDELCIDGYCLTEDNLKYTLSTHSPFHLCWILWILDIFNESIDCTFVFMTESSHEINMK